MIQAYMKNRYLTLLLFVILVVSQNALAQLKTIISGTIENATPNDSVQITYDPTYVSKRTITHKVPVLQNQFKVELVLDKSRCINFSYQSQSLQLFVEPEDNLNLQFKSSNLFDIAYSGKGSDNNMCYKKFNDQFQNDFNVATMEEQMKSTGIDEFEIKIFDNRRKHKKFIIDYPSKVLLTQSFVAFMDNHIKYNYLHHLLSYPIVNANKSNTITTVTALPKVMLESIDKKTVNVPEALISDAYRGFVIRFVTYFASELNGFNKFTDFNLSADKKYVIASEYFKGEPLLYYLSNFMLDMGEKLHPETVKRIYTEMEKANPKSEYTIIVKQTLGKWMKTKLPKDKEVKQDIASSDFKLMGVDGKEFSIADFKGKVVYVDFWASWCGPCREQFPYSKQLHDKLTEKQKKDIVFLYISIDNTVEIWKNAMLKYNLEGEHGLSSGGWNSAAAKYYKLTSIPRYMLIDKKGNVVDPNAKRPSDENIFQDIINLF